MTNRNTRRAFLASLMALILCVSSLLGTTYAWFTDSVTSSNNKIVAGNLDVELEYYDGSKWVAFNNETNVFKEGALWEPGHTEVVYLKVSNLGSLALKYNLGVNIANETAGINAAGDVFFLSDYIEFGVIETETESFFADRDAARKAVTDAKIISKGYAKSSKLETKGAAEYVALVVYMPETVGNEANFKTGTNAPIINLGISVFATQLSSEGDSYGTDYDALAPWLGEVDTTWYNTTDTEFTLTNAGQLAGFAELVNGGNTFAGKTVKLGADINLNNVNWTPIGTKSAEGEKAFARTFAGSFDGQGHTISNLKVVGGNALGLFGRTGTGTHIEDLNIVNAYVSGNDYVGAIAGYAYLSANCIKNCTVENATIIATPYKLANGKYDGGAKAGVIVGYALNGNVIGNTVKNSTVTAYRDLGGIVGMLNSDGIGDRTLTASGNTVEGVTLSYVGVPGVYADGKGNENMNDIVGRVGSKSSVGENTVTNIKRDEANKGTTVIYTLEELIAFTKDVNAGNTYAGKTVILGDDIDLLNMEWTPIGTGAGFNGTFDGNEKTVSNLKITGNKSTVGFFANTYDGEIKNLTIKNAAVSGDQNVGVVAGNPYTSKYTNITVIGHVEVNGFSYVGGVGGKNAYANWDKITVNVDADSYVNANSVENGKAYRSYVGGVVGFNGEGGHSFTNITSNINVYGSTCDVGGAFGIAHYNNKFENITVSGNVEIYNAVIPEEIGGIAGVWHNQNGTTVTFEDCKFTGTLTVSDASVDVSNNKIVGKKYSATGTGELIIVNYVVDDGITYAIDGVAGDKTLYLVPADYADAEVEIPEGVTAIGNYAFAYNSNVETVILPSTVKDLGRGFDSSTVKKVVLNEGLEVISSRAFRSTVALEEVVISSTVVEIADNAFQKSGIKEIVIPASVKTIGEAAFGSSLIETVTFEGDIAIQGYAFRGCTKLSTVNMNGYNVTFIASTLNNRNSCWFCNGESNNPNTSNITFNVKTDVIKDRVLAAMGAEKNNTPVNVEMTAEEGGYYLDAAGNAVVYNAKALDAALNDGTVESIILSGDLNFNASETTANSGYGATGVSVKGGVLDGNGNSLGINNWDTWDSAVHTTGGTIKNLTINSGMRGIFMGSATADVYIENVTIDGTIYTFNSDGGSKEYGVYISNSTLNGWTSFSDVHKEVVFTNCDFGEGQGYAYCRPYNAAKFVGCDFEAGFTVEPIGAVTFENCTIGGVPLTAENVADLVTSTDNVTVK